MSPARYRNPRTGAQWPVSEALWRAPDDGGYVNLTPGEGLTPGDIDPSAQGLWRYGAAIRLSGPPAFTLGEGWTPLVRASYAGIEVLMKMEPLMPSGSFKDRGTTVMLNALFQAGIRSILEDSSGNAGASIATYAAAAGMECRVFVPEATAAPKVVQIAATGADVERIAGSRQDVADAALRVAETVFYASHNWEPHFLEGTKTLAFELWEQLGFAAPDAVVVPCGYGSNVIGLHLGFSELLARGQVDKLPRIYAVQAANCAPFHAAFLAGADHLVDYDLSETLAEGIASSKPLRIPEVMAALRESRGATVTVTEEEIVIALGRLARRGFFVEPTCATAGAALEKLVAEGAINPAETIVTVLTGTGLKAAEKIGGALGI